MFTINGESWQVVLVPNNHFMLTRRDGSQSVGACDDPTKTIYIKEAEGQVEQESQFLDVDTTMLKHTLEIMFENLLNQGKTIEQAKAYLKYIEPFNNYEDLIDNL